MILLNGRRLLLIGPYYGRHNIRLGSSITARVLVIKIHIIIWAVMYVNYKQNLAALSKTASSFRNKFKFTLHFTSKRFIA